MAKPRDYADRLRQEIDRGRAADKTDFADPAAAPLGTDDEAAGTPPTAAQVAMARAAEVQARPDARAAGRERRTPGALQRPSTDLGVWTVVLVCLGLVLLALGLVAA